MSQVRQLQTEGMDWSKCFGVTLNAQMPELWWSEGACLFPKGQARGPGQVGPWPPCLGGPLQATFLSCLWQVDGPLRWPKRQGRKHRLVASGQQAELQGRILWEPNMSCQMPGGITTGD